MATPLTPSQLLALLKAEGLTVKEYSGWRDRCRCHTGSHEKGVGRNSRGWGQVNGTVVHITAGNLGGRTVQQYIAAAILGDPAIPCKVQHVVDPDGVVWLVSAGRCNHAGKVGSKVQAHLIAADYSLTDDYDDRYRGGTTDGNSFTYGIENIAASSMNAKQRASSVKICAAIARHYGWTGQESVGHGEISSARVKADPNLDMGKFRKDVMAAVKAGTTATTPPVATPPATPPKPKTQTVSVLLLPTAGYNADNAKGVTHWEANTRGLAALVNKYDPDFVGTTELSNRKIDPMLPLFEKLLSGYTKDKSGSDGRYVYRRKATSNNLASGHVNAAASTLLNGDDKQGAWSANKLESGLPVGIIALHTENEDGVDKKTHKNADDLRPLQVESITSQAVKKITAVGVPAEHIIVIGDFNSDAYAKDAMVKLGWKAAGNGFFIGWDHKSKDPIDWALIKAPSTATVKVITHSFGDHTALLITWTIPV